MRRFFGMSDHGIIRARTKEHIDDDQVIDELANKKKKKNGYYFITFKI